ncbi:SRSF protein kinase 3 [Cladobotryum mycophilum]|uniref:EKC/KEOPS complex subunit BUD32 n=1 Tax=Cladobotryum mycophilum TaxID=491253 RepID=A0ABR0SGP0_9HYPO
MATQLLKDIVSDLLKEMLPKLLQDMVPGLLEGMVPKILQEITPALLQETLPELLQEKVPGMVSEMVSEMQGQFGAEGDRYPYDYDTDDQPIPNAQGAFIRGDREAIEDFQRYNKGGYHPVHLGDMLGPKKEYMVVHKLGFGGFGTVWLCRNHDQKKWVAIKIMTADAIAEQEKAPVEIQLMSLDRSMPGAEFTALPVDHFKLDGPNGTHQCIVLPFLGPCVSPNLWTRFSNPAPVLRSLCQQATQAMQFLHKNNLCHGDFRPANILLKIKDMDHLGDKQLLSILGNPCVTLVEMEEGRKRPASIPMYLVNPVDLSDCLPDEYLTEEICLVDFGEAFPMDSVPRALGIPVGYVPPEILIEGDDTPVIAPASDIWALGCTLYEIRRQARLINMADDYDDCLLDLKLILGKLPESMWEKWADRGLYFDEHGERLGENLDDIPEDERDRSMEWNLKQPLQASWPPKKSFIDEEEQKVLADLLRKVLRYEPAERFSLEEVLEHEWFKM